MFSHSLIKIVKSLDKKKFRQKYNLFLVEGNKTIAELKNSNIIVKEIFSIKPSDIDFTQVPITEISLSDLKKISFLQHPKDSVALCEIPEVKIHHNIKRQLVLDGVQDPGNLGTIIRLADWFGIEQMVCSLDTVDVYNPKVIQASMGSFTRVNVVYADLEDFFKQNKLPVLGADIVGKSIYQFQFPKEFVLVLGNEGNGIRNEMEFYLTDKITIPRFGNTQSTESLNVSMATGIILGEIFSKD